MRCASSAAVPARVIPCYLSVIAFLRIVSLFFPDGRIRARVTTVKTEPRVRAVQKTRTRTNLAAKRTVFSSMLHF